MAERTKFLSYCIYSGIISGLIYPIEAHWIWGGGWLAQLGFHDFAGSTAIHMVGGTAALIGAYVSLQIRTDNFDVAAESLETSKLALRVKEMVFSEAKKIMDSGEVKESDRIAA
jgi:ammonia channel protein AmtB